MKFLETKLKGAYVIEPERLEDERGFFARVYCRDEFEQAGLKFDFMQFSISFSTLKHTLRGMHYQTAPHAETKLIRCTGGAVYDVIIDMRPESCTYRQWIAVELSYENRRILYVPECFAHGFLTLADNSEVLYQITPAYAGASAKGVRFDDPSLGIEWPGQPAVINDRDRNFPLLAAVS